MTDIPKYIRIFQAEPTDEFVEKRIAAIARIVEKFQKRKTSADCLTLANDITICSLDENLRDDFASEIEKEIRAVSQSFVRTEGDLQIRVCALLAADKFLTEAKPVASKLLKVDIVALGLWSSLSFQKPRLEDRIEELRKSLLTHSRSWVVEGAVNARSRQTVPDIRMPPEDTSDANTFYAKLKPVLDSVVQPLRTNAVLDREEIDFLWWSLSDYSRIFNLKMSSLPSSVQAITSGIEGAKLLRRLPAEVHKHLILRNIADDTEVDLTSLFGLLGMHQAKLKEFLINDLDIQQCPHIFPLLTELVQETTITTNKEQKRTIQEWGARSLLESSILHLTTLPNDGL